MNKLTVYLVRHGETSFNAEGNKYCGRTDVALNEVGKKQAENLCSYFKDTHIDVAFSSPLKRANSTAKILLPNQEIFVDNRLVELDFGKWEGKTREEFVIESPELWDKWNSDPSNNRAGGTGETANEAVMRINDFFNEIEGQYQQKNILMVAHNTINRFFLCSQLGMPFRNYRKIFQENCAITKFEIDQKEGFILKKLNCRSF
ncbi:Phosphoglycerate mutase [Indibacter alkaliphilus LW1]|uniref:Phosphoglycerate mutase n=1 Tax=Indibacter alkaliphilus (strain CCUG 57479 / KCTC 22604 / LW1) TaxID=1189612 RepID=S2DZV4_INDAL|nr:histidine phosphatase family protein [Indibacter alkaliphilus]EOZ95338.1 Phosphoglycerate mutase [Indibacter alkaliphilus LW1]